jgi:hypothetical protein
VTLLLFPALTNKLCSLSHGVTFLLPGAQYQHLGLAYAAEGRLPITVGRGAFSYLADRVGMAEPGVYSAIALGF